MNNKAYDLSSYSFSRGEQILVDTNIWLYLFPAPGNPQLGFARQYSSYQKKRRRKDPEKDSARRRVSRAVKNGELKRKPCEVCGSFYSQAHHEDYSKPLDVIWLCRKHHLELHGKVAYA